MSPSPSAPDDPCPLCGGRGQPWRERHGYPVLACQRCGNGYLPPSLVPDDLEDLYREGYFEGAADTGYPGYLGDSRLVEINFAKRVRWIESLRPPGRRLLDVGAAYGLFVRAAERRGFRASGVELAPECVEHARDVGLEILQGDFLTAELPGPFDVITLFDVIEHFRDPDAVLRRIHELLTPDGLVVVETGDMAAPWARGLGNHWYFLDPPQHLFYFSEGGLTALLRRCGFTGPCYTRRMGRRVSLANVGFKLGAAVPEGPVRRLLRGARLPGWVYLNFGDVFMVAARRP